MMNESKYLPPKVISRNKNFRITYHECKKPAATIVITFGEVDSSLSNTGFASQLCFDSNVDHIYVAQKVGTQYQYLSQEKLLSVVKEVIKGKKVITYGSSLGGYCAIYYAGVLNADVLSFSPRIPAHPAIDILMQQRFKNRGFKHLEIVDGSLTSGRVKVFYDPDNYIDDYYVKCFVKPAYPNAELCRIVGAGHYTARALAVSGCLKKVVKGFFFGGDETFSVDHAALLDWNKKIIKARLRRGKLQHAIENFVAVTHSPAMSEHDVRDYNYWFHKKMKAAQISTKMNSEPVPHIIGEEEKNIIKNSKKLLFVGDLILLRKQLLNSYDHSVGDYNFYPMFSHVKKYIRESHFSIGVFEGPTAGEEFPLSTSSYADGIPLKLNYPDGFALAVKNAGFDLVTTAQNHLLDCGVKGAMRTIDILNSVGLDQVGCYKKKEDKEAVKIVDIDGIKVGVLAYTMRSNGYKSNFFFDPESSHVTSVLVSETDPYFHEAKQQVLDDFSRLKKSYSDCIVVLPHMGAQFRHSPDRFQNLWCNIFIDEGADIILSDHPHAVQPFEWRKKADGKNSLILHCPGNFVNSYTDKDGDISALVQVYMRPGNGEPLAASAVPLYAYAPYGGAYYPIPLHVLLEQTKCAPTLSQYEFSRVEECHRVFSKSMLGEQLPIDHIQEKYYVFSHRVSPLNETGYVRNLASPVDLSDCEDSYLVSALATAGSACFVGDSVTEGTKNGGYGWYEPLVANYPRLKVMNVSKGGKGSPYFLSKAKEIAACHADVYVLAIGANDVRYRNPKLCAMTAESFVENIRAIVGEVREHNPSSLIFLLSPWCSDDYDPVSKLKKAEREKMIIEYGNALESFCEKKDNLFFIDQNPVLLDEFKKKDPRFYLRDHIHPNANQGIALYSRAVALSSPEVTESVAPSDSSAGFKTWIHRITAAVR